MGVHATWCQLCGLPTQHDHYVPSASGMLRIYRGSMEGGGHDWTAEALQPFAFGPEHAWLMDAVALTEDGEVLRGTVTDGGLAPRGGDEPGELYVGRGDEDALVLHHACWTLMGEPGLAEEVVRGTGLHAWARIEPYQEQLFEFAELAGDGKGAWLADPAGSSVAAKVSRARLEAILAETRARPLSLDLPLSVPGVLRTDRTWRGVAARRDDRQRFAQVHWRELSEDLERADWPHLLCLIRNVPGDDFPGAQALAALEDFELRFKAALESDALGIAVMVSINPGKAQYLAYVRDEAEAKRRVDALDWGSSPGLSEYDNAHDPAWRTLFHDLAMPRR